MNGLNACGEGVREGDTSTTWYREMLNGHSVRSKTELMHISTVSKFKYLTPPFSGELRTSRIILDSQICTNGYVSPLANVHKIANTLK